MHKNNRYVLIGDAIGLLLFVIIGQANHGTLNIAQLANDVLITAAPFVIVWLVVALSLRSYRLHKGWWASMQPLLLGWLIAAPWGVVLRAFFIGRLSTSAVFVITTFVFGLLILAAWRTVAWLVWGRKAT